MWMPADEKIDKKLTRDNLVVELAMYFKTRTKERLSLNQKDKIDGVLNLIDYFNGKAFKFTDKTRAALKEKRLGRIVSKYEPMFSDRTRKMIYSEKGQIDGPTISVGYRN